MRIQELVKRLNELEKKHGNLEVVLWDSYFEDCGSYESYIDEVKYKFWEATKEHVIHITY